MDERGAVRFNTVHVPAGSATGGQFGTSSGGGAKSSGAKAPAKAPAKTPAKTAPAHAMSAAHAAEKARLLAEAHKDAAEARALEKTLAGLEKQEHAAQVASKKSAAAAAASLKAGHVVHHRKHAAHHAHHRRHAASLKQRITTLKGKIRALREKAAGLEKQANAIRSGDSGIPGVLPHQLAAWWEHGEGAARIGWGTPGSFDRCVRLAVSEAHMDPERAKGFCAERYHAATGTWPGAHSGKHAERADMATDTKAKPYGNVTYADPKNGKYPVDTEAHARAAWSYINMPKNAAQYPVNGVTLSEVKDRIMAACKKFGIDVSDSSSASRGEPVYFRTYELEDIHIVRTAQGDSTGRLVEAYATAFNAPAEIQDFEGHYIEEIDPAAFNKVLADIGRSRAGFGKVKVMYNHGMTIHGTPSERGSMPIATPVDIRPEARGLLTLARYSDTPFADEVLENIRNGSITAQSFTGRIVRSDPQLRRGERHRPRGGQLTRVRRTELGLKEFGPTPFEAYSGAEILGVRMSTPGAFGDPEPDEHDEALPPDEEAAAGEPLTPEGEHSARYHQHALYVLRSREQREKAGLVW